MRLEFRRVLFRSEAQIDRALTGRAEQRPFVAQLAVAWAEVARGFEELVRAAEDVGSRTPDAPSSPGSDAGAAVAAVLADPGTAGTPAPRRLTARIHEVQRRIDAVQARVDRD